MTSALAAPFVDMKNNDILYQTQHLDFLASIGQPIRPANMNMMPTHMHERKPVLPARSRNSSGNSTNLSSPTSSGKLSPCSMNSMISFEDSLQQGYVNNSAQITQSNHFVANLHRKLDRSISEPVDRIALEQQRQNAKGPVNASRYKTELCRPYEESGNCKYGDKCQFAHGMHELRTLTRHPKYKTDLCRTFHTVGFCPYGPRCHFIHNEDERKLSQINHMKHQQAIQHQVQLQNTAAQMTHMINAQQVAAAQHLRQLSMQQQATQPQPTQGSIQRPKLNFSLSMPATRVLQDTLGSTANSPPASDTDSNLSLSPGVFTSEDLMASRITSLTPPPGLPTPNQPFQQQPQQSSSFFAPLSDLPESTPAVDELIASLQATPISTDELIEVFLNNMNLNAPPSPPESYNGDDSPVVPPTPTPVQQTSGESSPRLEVFKMLEVNNYTL